MKNVSIYYVVDVHPESVRCYSQKVSMLISGYVWEVVEVTGIGDRRYLRFTAGSLVGEV